MKPIQDEKTMLEAFFQYFDLVFHTTVRTIRSQSGGNPTLGLLTTVAQTLTMVMIFYLMFAVIGMRTSSIRGDPMLFLVSGILLFFLHNNAVQATVSSGSSVGALMMHAPMTPTLVIISTVLSKLYLHTLVMFIIIGGLYLFRGEVEIHDPPAVILPFFLAWISGVVVGLLMLVFKPFAPKLANIISTIYQRANMITSGKFFVANMLPGSILPFFSWNPLFHSIDQMRGALFVNYYPHNTSLSYPIKFVMVGLLIGLMFEFWLRKTVSKSTSKRK